MKKSKPELVEMRRQEIIDACEQLYRTKSFKEINLKEIGVITSFSRPTIYNYFESKEEIFLALFKREYDAWNEALEEILAREGLSVQEALICVAESLQNRVQLLKLLAMNLYDMEENSRLELLIAFKESYAHSFELLMKVFGKFCPGMTDKEIAEVTLLFFEAMNGFYAYIYHTDKQKEAMKRMNLNCDNGTIKDLALLCLNRLLGITTHQA